MSRLGKRLLLGCALVCPIVLLVGVLYAYHLSNPLIQISSVNRKKFANVVVLLDGTHSISDQALADSKQVVITGIIPSIGVGDRLSIYSIGPEFGLENVISGATVDEQPAQFDAQRRTEVLAILEQSRSTNAPGRVRNKLYDLVSDAHMDKSHLDNVHSHWMSQVAAMRRPTKPGTNITCALDAIDAYFQSTPSADEDRWLFVLSDLVQEQASTALCSSSNPEELLSSTHIVFLYPHDSRHDWRKIIESWRVYLGDRYIDTFPLSAALNMPFVMPPNPLSGLDGYTIRSFWVNLRSLV